MLYADAVFEGGGVKGIGLVGAVCRLEEAGYSWKRIAGTSAGAIIAALLAVGYSGKEIKKIMLGMDYNRFNDTNRIQSIPLVGGLLGTLFERGIYSGDYVEKWLENLLSIKGKTKFKDVYHDGESRLKIIASDITQKELLILPDDLKRYDIDPLEFSISKAVRMSIGIPLYYKPVKLNHAQKDNYIVDGGILSNFPVWIFDVKDKPRWPTFGFKLVEPNLNEGKTQRGILAYILDIMSTMLEGNDARYIKNADFVRTIPIPTLGVRTTEFSISRDRSIMLFKSGYKSAEVFINQWNFEKYIEEFRVKAPPSRKETLMGQGCFCEKAKNDYIKNLKIKE